MRQDGYLKRQVRQSNEMSGLVIAAPKPNQLDPVVANGSSENVVSTGDSSCRSGEIGRRTGLKIQRWQHHLGSIPSFGTLK